MTEKTIHAEKILLGSEQGQHLCLSAAHGVQLYVGQQLQASFSLGHHGRPCLSFYDPNGQERISLFIENGGTPELYLNDGNERSRLLCRVSSSGMPSVALHDAHGETRLSCDLWEDDCTPHVYLHDKNGNACSLISADDTGALSFRQKSAEGTWLPWTPDVKGK